MTAPTAGALSAADDLELDEANPSVEHVTKTPTVPTKYAGKSVEDLIQMHQNAERALSRQGNEAGELRRLADAIITGQTQNNAKKEAVKPLNVQTLLDDPEQALTQALERSPVAQRQQTQEQRLNELEGQISYNEFVSKHTNYQEDASSPEFLKWVQKNHIRSQLAIRADKHDYRAAKDLFDLWDEYKEVANVDDKVADIQQQRQDKLNKVRTTRSAASEGRVVAKYSRAKLMALRMRVQDGEPDALAKWNDPQFQADMLAAYSEKRVL